MWNIMHETSLHETNLHQTSLHETSLHTTSLNKTSLHETNLYETLTQVITIPNKMRHIQLFAFQHIWKGTDPCKPANI